ncbi:MAG: hypothetical protein KJZ91_12865 [Myxococcales bacterium]|nr:hypothetical protein [Myxococcales bacterium]
MSRGALVALALTAAAPAAHAAAPTVHTDTAEVRACLPLPDGGALFGTAGGLVRATADGRRRALWTATSGLPGTRIEAVLGDGDHVWIGADGGAARVRVDGERLAIERTLASAPVRDLVRHDGALYAATWGDGVLRVGARGGGARVAFAGGARGARGRVAAMAVGDGALWAGTAAGLFVLRGARLEPVALPRAGGAAAPAVTSLHADGARLWIATSDGLFVREGGAVRPLGGGYLTRVTAVGGAVVVASLGDGLRVVDRGHLVALAGAPRALRLAQAVAGAGEAACAGGLEGAWLRPSRAAGWRAAPAPAPEVPSNDVAALASDGGRLWVGTFDRGLAVHDGRGWRAVAHPDLDRRVNALLVEPRPGRASRLWIGTAAGLMVLDGDDVARLGRRDGLPGRGVLALARLRDGRIVAGTSSGAVLVGDGAPVPVGPPGTRIGNVWAVAEDADGWLWLGTTTGVWRGPATAEAKAGPRGAGWQRLAVATGHLDDDWVMAIAARGRAVWVGGYKSGVIRFDLDAPGREVTGPGVRLGGGWVNPAGLRWDGDRLLVATQDGLKHGDGQRARWTPIGGAPGKDVTATADVDGARWIATRRGLVRAAP